MKKDHSPAPGQEPRNAAAAAVSLQTSNEEILSRFVHTELESFYPGDAAPVQCLPCHQLVYCLTGGGECLVGQQRFVLNRGDVLSIPAGAIFRWTLSEQHTEACHRYVTRLSPEFIQLMKAVFLSDTSALAPVPYLLSTEEPEWNTLGDYFRRSAQECERKLLRWDASVFGIATELMVQIARARIGPQEAVPAKTDLLDRIMVHIEAHLAEKITLPDIAARFWVSQSTISQLFRKKMGMSFYRYVTLRRLTEAQLLIPSGIPMDQVSIAVGFQDYSTFYRAFKAEYGISPAQYRKNH